MMQYFARKSSERVKQDEKINLLIYQQSQVANLNGTRSVAIALLTAVESYLH